MSHLLDVSFLLACGWDSHSKHEAARKWLERQNSFTTCPLSELGFLRVSMTAGYRASFADAVLALEDITRRKQARWVADDFAPARLPVITSHTDVTDAYFVELARKHRLKLATLDEHLCKKAWAAGVAENPV